MQTCANLLKLVQTYARQKLLCTKVEIWTGVEVQKNSLVWRESSGDVHQIQKVIPIMGQVLAGFHRHASVSHEDERSYLSSVSLTQDSVCSPKESQKHCVQLRRQDNLHLPVFPPAQ